MEMWLNKSAADARGIPRDLPAMASGDAEQSNGKPYRLEPSKSQPGRWAIIGPNLYLSVPSESIGEAILALLLGKPKLAAARIEHYHEENPCN